MLLPQKKTGTDYLSFLKVANILKKESIQVIHTHNTQPLVDGTLGAILSGGRQRIVHTDHARRFPDKKRYMFAEWCMSHFVYKMIGVSEQTTEILHKYEKIPKKKLMTIKNGIDGSRFAINIDRQAKRKELGISLAGQVIGVISRLEKVKGITYLLQAMPEIIKTFPDLTLLIVGDGSEMDNLQAETNQLGFEQNVIFTGARHDIPEIFQMLDIYLLPSISEGLPMGLLEAMAAGCPTIAAEIGGIPSVITHGRSGSLIPVRNPDRITEEIIYLLSNETLRARYSKFARLTIKNTFSARKMTAYYEHCYVEDWV